MRSECKYSPIGIAVNDDEFSRKTGAVVKLTQDHNGKKMMMMMMMIWSRRTHRNREQTWTGHLACRTEARWAGVFFGGVGDAVLFNDYLPALYTKRPAGNLEGATH